jgi:site-specific DNA-methyltransferase (adenine-specific)
MKQLPRNTILTGDAATVMQTLPSASVDCVITSPPYYQLRDYGVGGQLGLEPSVDDWVAGLRQVLAEVARVLKPAGALWLNVADSFSRHPRYGAPPKGLLLAPERLLLALARDGWRVRNKAVWAKPNPMPSSVTDRLSLTYEVLYLLVRERRYWFDLDAIREPHRSHGSKRARPPLVLAPSWAGPLAGRHDGLQRARPAGMPGHVLGKNPGDVWTIPTGCDRRGHQATFPEALVERPILATCPERICVQCDRAFTRPTRIVTRHTAEGPRHVRRVGRLRRCDCFAPTRSGVVLDPFAGTGTTLAVAKRLRRDWLGIELNRKYADLAADRLGIGGCAASGRDHLSARRFSHPNTQRRWGR